MRILKPHGLEIEFDDKKRHLLFNVNVIDEIQEKYDSCIADILNSLLDNSNKENERKSYERITFILQTLLNEDVSIHNEHNPHDQWEDISETFIKRELLANENAKIFIPLLIQSFNGELPKATEEDDPNQKSEDMKK